MKYQLNRLAVTIGLSAVMGSALLIAASGPKETAEIPFDFQVKDHVMPAGTYSVQPMNNATTLVIRNEGTGESMITLAPLEKSGKAGDARLVFNRYGDRYFLAQVWFAYDGAGHGLIPSRAEKEIAPDGAGVLASVRLK
jgi:hypothetical protein